MGNEWNEIDEWIKKEKTKGESHGLVWNRPEEGEEKACTAARTLFNQLVLFHSRRLSSSLSILYPIPNRTPIWNYEDTPDWAIWPIIFRRKQSQRDLLLMLDVDTEGVLEYWTNKLYNYPFLVREAEASETEIEGEIFLGFPHEHDPYLQESTID